MNFAHPRMHEIPVAKAPRVPRVLIAEDSMLIAMELENILDDCGCVVAGICASTEEAIPIVDKNGCDLALVDYCLSDGSAETLIEALRRKSIPFILCTGQSESEMIPESKGEPVISKPYTIDDVQSAVIELMAKVGPER